MTERAGVKMDLQSAMPWRIVAQLANPVLTSFSNYRIVTPFHLPSAKLRQAAQIARQKVVMAFRGKLMARTAFSRLMYVSVYLCIFSFLPAPQVSVLAWAQSAEVECPCEEDGERSNQEQVVSSSARRPLKDRHHRDLTRLHEIGDRFHPIASCDGRRQAIVGHRLANGLCAPLLI